VTTQSMSKGVVVGIDPRTKLAWLGLVVVTLFLFEEPAVQFTVALLALALAMIGSVRGTYKFEAIVGVFKALAGLLIMVVVLQGFLRGGETSIFSFKVLSWTVRFTLEGVTLGLVVASRFVSISLCAVMFFLTTDAYALSIGLYRMGVPFRFAYLVSMALERLPKTLGLLRAIENAQAARGFDVERGNILQRVMNVMPIIIPLEINVLREAGQMAVALEIRGFETAKTVSFLYDLSFRRSDMVLTVLAGVGLLAALGMKVIRVLGLV